MLYYIILNGSQFGPYSLREMERMWVSGFISSETLVWNESLPKWKTYGEVFTEVPPKEKSSDAILPDTVTQRLSGVSRWVLVLFMVMGLGMLVIGVMVLSLVREASAQISRVESVVNKYLADKEKAAGKVVKVDVVRDRTKDKVVIEYEYRFELWSRDKADSAGKGGKLDMDGWEYVGPLCNNGLNAQYVLFRRSAGQGKPLR